jgi:protein gp37
LAKVKRKEEKKIQKTKIEWVKSPHWEWTDYSGQIHIEGGEQGYTWNAITGCLNHVNGLCKGGGFPCYAYRLAYGRLCERYLANSNYIGQDTGIGLDDVTNLSKNLEPSLDPFYPRFWPERLNEPLYGKDKGIFVCDMSDLFGVGIPESWTASVLDVIKRSPHRFYLLTKQPQNLIKWSPFPENCWVGVTATDGHRFVDALNNLIHVKASVQFISLEPLLNWHIPSWLVETNLKSQPEIKWLIIGAQTKPYKPPKIEWVQEIVEAADRAGIPVFLKDNLRPLLKHEFPFVNYRSMTQPEGELRQELPK